MPAELDGRHEREASCAQPSPAQAGVSLSFFFARSACLLVMAPASTISSIFLSFVICFSVVFALRIFWVDVGTANL